jgi:hypothetical protein
LINEYVGGVGQGRKGCLGIEKEGAFGSLSVRIPGSSKQELVRIGPKVKIQVIQGMSQVAQGFVTKTMLIGRIVIPLYLVHVGIQGHILEPGEIMLKLPGIDVKGGINHLSAYSRSQGKNKKGYVDRSSHRRLILREH